MEKKLFKLKYQASITPVDSAHPVEFWFALPPQNRYQILKKSAFNIEPSSSYVDEQGNKLCYFRATGQQIKFISELEVVLIDDNARDAKAKLSRFLKDEKFLCQSPKVRYLVAKVTEGLSDDLNTAKAMFRYIVKNFSYKYPVSKRGVENLNLAKLEGDCAEYSSLFVTMCRIADIPARNQTGFVIFLEENEVSEHAWAQVNLKGIGWVDMDTQYASFEENADKGMKLYFAKRSDLRVNFVNGFNVILKPFKKPISVSRKDDMIFTSNPIIQCLQPLALKNSNIKKFSEKMVLIK